MSNLQQRLKSAVADIQARDTELAAELRDVTPKAERMTRTVINEAAVEGVGEPQLTPQMLPETIVLRTGRPVLAVLNDKPELVFREAESEVWRNRLTQAKDQIGAAVRAVGRVEVQNHPSFEWIGTGWLVSEDVIVTNRHVAQEFGMRHGARFRFRQGTLGRTMKASMDFLEEFGNNTSREFSVAEVLHIEDDLGPDMALLRVTRGGNQPLASPIQLSAHAVIEKQHVAVIGYPARDSRIPDQQLMIDIFGDVFDKKRLAPGQIIRATNASVEHDCSTLGGNSGSVVLDLQSGAAVGLHFAGRFLQANFAVAAGIVVQRLRQIGRGESVSGGRSIDQGVDRQRVEVQRSGRQLSVTVPVRITVDVGDPLSDGDVARPAAATMSSPAVATSAAAADAGAGEDDELVLTEARPEDYADREGYKADFLGGGIDVPLPEVKRNPGDLLKFEFNGRTRSLLDYQHFSVVMNLRRKMCIFSAVNINGKQPHKSKRPGWRTDPRIPEAMQTVRGPYGNPPKFARGHMTRREDPMWGTPETAKRGNADSMHVTNAVPQMQPFNAGIWLGLEDYALQNAREDDMRICVFTGPVFRDNDPSRFGVKIPIKFWKVIVFIHDETGELSATGYTMSQKSFLQEDEFVFGAHSTAQTTIAEIENLSGLSFGELTNLDPLPGDVDEAVGSRDLAAFEQIRFVK